MKENKTEEEGTRAVLWRTANPLKPLNPEWRSDHTFRAHVHTSPHLSHVNTSSSSSPFQAEGGLLGPRKTDDEIKRMVARELDEQERALSERLGESSPHLPPGIEFLPDSLFHFFARSLSPLSLSLPPPSTLSTTPPPPSRGRLPRLHPSVLLLFALASMNVFPAVRL